MASYLLPVGSPLSQPQAALEAAQHSDAMPAALPNTTEPQAGALAGQLPSPGCSCYSPARGCGGAWLGGKAQQRCSDNGRWRAVVNDARPPLAGVHHPPLGGHSPQQIL
jgi:hypothetical protein